ncbi:hypothetical protein PIIN_03222 [Serendipita indica DSM 11827]|uniref:Uncharacterized protein n=1 Tax=Serendipita indica (strain DSM 11827) TaxID=1109443 RepID=G4TDE3_SERID|nr:hypothetical protein PIIN_03222 [Serendipita indica DSM 11827]
MLHPLVYFLVLFSSSIRAAIASTSIPGQNGDYSCGQGVQGRVTHLQRGSVEPFQPDIFVTDCSGLKASAPSLPGTSPNDLSSQSNAHFPENRLGKRQFISKCGSTCATVCSLASNGPSYNDCSTLSNYLFGRGSQFSVGALQKVSVTAGSCMYTFLNMNLFSVSWCDETWAAQGGSVSGSCSAGGSCLGLLFTVGCAPLSQPGHNPSDTPFAASKAIQILPPPPLLPSASTSSAQPTSSQNAPSSPAALSSSLQSLSTLTATSSYVRTTTTLSNGAVVTVIASPDGTGTEENNNVGSGDQGATNKKSKSPVIAAVLLAVLLVIGIVIALIFWRRKRKEKKIPPPIYIDPARASTYDGEKPLNSPVAYTIHSSDEDHERGFGRAIRNSDSGHNGSGASARINSMMSGDTDLTIWTPRAKEQHQILSSTLVPVMTSDASHSDSPTTSTSGHQHQYHYTKVSGNTNNVVHPNLAGMGAPTLTIVSPTPSPTPRSPERITQHLAFSRDAPLSATDSDTNRGGIGRDANSEDDHSCYSREQLDEARADAAGVNLERISAPPVVLPSEISSPLSPTRILDEGARLSTSTGVASRSSRSMHIPSFLPAPRHPQRTTFGVENPASSGDILPRRSVDTSGARRSGRVSGSVIGARMSEEEVGGGEESPGFARLTTAFESASSVEGHSPFEQSSSTSK